MHKIKTAGASEHTVDVDIAVDRKYGERVPEAVTGCTRSDARSMYRRRTGLLLHVLASIEQRFRKLNYIHLGVRAGDNRFLPTLPVPLPVVVSRDPREFGALAC